jgi:hypothetical protein
MPCYTAWNEFLQPGTPAYAKAEAEVLAKLRSLQHAVNYYYAVADLALPLAHTRTDGGGFGGEQFRSQNPSSEEDEVLDRLTHHLACDGVHCTTIYDAVSLLDTNLREQAGYAWVLQTCAFRLRVMMTSELDRGHSLFALVSGRWYAAEFMADDLESDDPRRFSAVYIYRTHPLKTGGGLLKVHFWQESHAEGAQARESTWKVLERTPGFLLARINDHPVRLAHIRELSWKWLGDRLRIYPKPGEVDVQARMGTR